MSDIEKPSWEWRQEVEAITAELEHTKSAMASEYEMDMNDQIRKRRAVEQQIADTHAHLESQRQATYQAVEREHAAKQQLATARREAWEEAAKLCEQLYDASHDREAAFYEALLTAAHAIRAQAAKEWRSYFAAS